MDTLPRLLLIVLCVVVCTAVQVHAEDEPRTIYVSGTSEIILETDYVEWEVDLRDLDLDPVKAKAMNDDRYEAVLKLAKDLDIDKDDVVIGEVSIYKTTKKNKDGEYVFAGYVVKREMVLIQRELEEFDEMLARLAGFKAEFDISYGSAKLRETKRKAQLAAVKAAREKAEALAGVLGQKVGRPLYIEDHDVDVGFDLNDALSNTSSGGGGDRDGTRYGSITVRSGVDIRFELLDN